MSPGLTLSEAKMAYDWATIDTFAILSIAEGWEIHLIKGGRQSVLQTAQRKDRVFKTLDACVPALRQIGFDVDILNGHTKGI